MTLPKTHPRYQSLRIRERLTDGVRTGITSQVGLIAHGRGEAFDYLLGERTTGPALRAEETAVAMLLAASRPVLSVNGNVAALVPGEIIELGRVLNAAIEINLFYKTEERVRAIADHLHLHGAAGVLGIRPDAALNRLPPDHPRSRVCKSGIYDADVVLVPLEDGDRCKALTDMGKSVITIDLNPLSRTAKTATVTIVDNVVRAIPNMIGLALRMKDLSVDRLDDIVSRYDNEETLRAAIEEIVTHGVAGI